MRQFQPPSQQFSRRPAVVIICGLLVTAAFIGWVRFNVSPIWEYWDEWRASGALVQNLEQLTEDAVQLPAYPPKVVDGCAAIAEGVSVPSDLLARLQSADVQHLMFWSQGCEVMHYFTPGVAPEGRYPALGLFALWLHVLLGQAVQEGWLASDTHLSDIESLSRIAPVNAVTPARTSMHNIAPELMSELLKDSSWGIPLAQSMESLDEEQQAQLGLQLWAQVLQKHYGLPLDQLLNERLREPLGVSTAATLGVGKDGMPLAFCCYYATAQEFATLGSLYSSNVMQNVPANWLNTLSGWTAIGDGRVMARADSLYIYMHRDRQWTIFVRSNAKEKIVREFFESWSAGSLVQ